jgi:hypothetical protein
MTSLVNQRRRVNHLDHRAERYMLVGHAACRLRRQQQQRRPQPFPAQTKRMFHELIDERIAALQLVAKPIVDRRQRFANRGIEHRERRPRVGRNRRVAVIRRERGPNGWRCGRRRHASFLVKCPLFPPDFSSRRMHSIEMPRSTALHMS